MFGASLQHCFAGKAGFGEDCLSRGFFAMDCKTVEALCEEEKAVSNPYTNILFILNPLTDEYMWFRSFYLERSSHGSAAFYAALPEWMMG